MSTFEFKDKFLKVVNEKSDDEINMSKIDLETLQILARIKIKSYKDKWSKKSDAQISLLEKIIDDEKALIKYFTKR
jgi:LAS superfamily LD-carboxypeptidase LdcB